MFKPKPYVHSEKKISCYFVHTDKESNPDFRESREAKDRNEYKQIIYHCKVQKTREKI